MGQGGADRVTLNLLKHLDRAAYSISLLLMKRQGEFLSQVPADVTVHSTDSANLWVFLPGLLRSIKQIQPDVVFSIDGGTNVPVAMAAFLKPRRPWKVILSERNVLFPPGTNRVKRTLLVALKFLFYRFADVLTAVSEGVRADMSRLLGVLTSRIQLVYNPMVEQSVLLQAKEPVGHPWLADNHVIPVVVHAGRFVPQKDHATLLHAFAQVHQKKACRLILLGDGPLRHEVQSLTASLGLQEDVFFAGFDVNPFKYFSRCDVFVLSSRHEGMPGVLIQAMACGAPVVSTDCPSGPNEIITQPEVNGILVPVQDIEAMASAIVRVLSDTDLSNRLKQQGPQAVAHFLVERAIESYTRAIER